MNERMDVIVVGGGVMGSATARALADAGARVALLERRHIGHDRGSSHGRARIFRFSYPDPGYVAMAQEALGLWRALEEEAGETLVVTTGGLDGGKRLDSHVAALEKCGAPFELVDGNEVAKRWTHMHLPVGEEVLFQPDAGVLLADRAWSAIAGSAMRKGAEVVEGAHVVGLETGRGGEVEVSVASDDSGRVDRKLSADVVVVTAGSWARELLEPVGIALDAKATRETVAFFDFDGPALPHLEGVEPQVLALPTFVDWGEPSVYALPSPGQGIKVGEHIAGPVTDPDEFGSPDGGSIERVARWVAERYPGAAREPRHAETCLYTVTPDEHFVLERHGPIVVGSPCSGHGFKFAPVIGERLAALAMK